MVAFGGPTLGFGSKRRWRLVTGQARFSGNWHAKHRTHAPEGRGEVEFFESGRRAGVRVLGKAEVGQVNIVVVVEIEETPALRLRRRLRAGEAIHQVNVIEQIDKAVAVKVASTKPDRQVLVVPGGDRNESTVRHWVDKLTKIISTAPRND